MMEALKLMHEGYPTRCPFDDLYGRYKDLMPAELANLDPASFVECLLMALEIPREKFQLGLTKVFFKSGQFALIDELTTNEDLIPEVARKVAIWLMRKRFKRSVFTICAYKKMVQRIDQKRAGDMFASVGMIMYIYSKTFRPLARRVQKDCRARHIQTAYRRMAARADFVETTTGAGTATRYIRRFLQAKNAEALIKDITDERIRKEEEEKERLAQMKDDERHAAIEAKNAAMRAKAEAALAKKTGGGMSKEAAEAAAAASEAAQQEAERLRGETERQNEEMQRMKEQMAEQMRQQQEAMQTQMAEMMATMSGNGPEEVNTGNAVADARAKRRAQGNAEDDWQGGGGLASSEQLKKFEKRMAELESTVATLKDELKEEQKARRALEQRLKAGVMGSPAGGPRATDAWARAKAAAATGSVPPPGSDPRGTRAPPPRPGSVPVPGGNPAADFETRSIEKEQLLQTVGDVVQQVKDHMSRPRVKGVTLGDDSTDPEIGKVIRNSFCEALIPILVRDKPPGPSTSSRAR